MDLNGVGSTEISKHYNLKLNKLPEICHYHQENLVGKLNLSYIQLNDATRLERITKVFDFIKYQFHSITNEQEEQINSSIKTNEEKFNECKEEKAISMNENIRHQSGQDWLLSLQ